MDFWQEMALIALEGTKDFLLAWTHDDEDTAREEATKALMRQNDRAIALMRARRLSSQASSEEP